MQTSSNLHHRHQFLPLRHYSDSQHNLESADAQADPLWLVDQDVEISQPNMDSPSSPLGKYPTRKHSRNHLRISTYTTSDLHERYLSSEEEPSPSPDTEHGGADAQEAHVTEEPQHDETDEPHSIEEYGAEIAIAVPILALGRPRLVNITNLAPMHKRKRSAEKPILRSATRHIPARIPDGNDKNALSDAHEDCKTTQPQEDAARLRKNRPDPAPETWLHDDHVHIVQEDEEYLPELELRKPPTYSDYDPFSLNPPRLSPRTSYNTPTKKQGSVARARKLSHPPQAMNNNPGRKGLGRSLSLAKKQEAQHPRGAAKKPRMLARAANEREDTPSIPKFRSDDGTKA